MLSSPAPRRNGARFWGLAGHLPSGCGPREASEYPLSLDDIGTVTPAQRHPGTPEVWFQAVRGKATQAQLFWDRSLAVDELRFGTELTFLKI